MRKRSSVPIGILTAWVVVAALSSPTSGASKKQKDTPTTLDDAIAALGSPDPMERARATCPLGTMRDAAGRAIPHLVKLMGDNTPITDFSCGMSRERWRHDDYTTPGREAAKTLTQMGPGAVEPLIEALASDDVTTRANAAFAMQMVFDPRVIEALLRAVNDESGEVRREVVWAMSSKEDPRTVPGLIAALARDPDSEVREKAAWSLGLIGDARSVEALIAALKDPAETVRAQAAWALGMTGDERAVEPLIGALDDPSVEVRAQAAWALGIIGDPRAEDPLRGIAENRSQPKRVRNQARRALKHLAAAQVAVEATRTLSIETVLAPGQRLRMEVERGSFRIEAADTDRARAEVSVTCFEGRRSCAKILSEVTLATTAAGNAMRLEIVAPRKKAAIRQLTFAVVITVPTTVPLTLQLHYGDITIHGLESDVVVDLGVGSVELEMPRRSVARVHLESDMGSQSLEGQGIDNADIRFRDHEHGGALTWGAGPGTAAVNVVVGVGSISARLL